MPSVFDRQFKINGFPNLLQHFGEPITYVTRSGVRYSLTAIIERSPPAVYDAGGNVVLYEFVIRFAGDCQLKAKDIDTGGDTVELIAKIGDVIPTTKTVMHMSSQDSGVIVLSLK